MLLLGNFQHSLDDKNRIRLPAKYREKLGNDYILMPGIGGCIFLYPAEAEEKFMRAVEEIGEFNTKSAETIRRIAEMSATVDADSQGRFMLPQELLQFAKIDKDVRIVGAINRIEIWSEELYTKRRSANDESAQAIDELYMEFHKSMSK